MTLDDSIHNTRAPRNDKQASIAKLVAVPFIPGLTERGQTPVATIANLPTQPLSSVSAPSKDCESKVHHCTQEATFTVAHDCTENPLPRKQFVKDPIESTFDVYATSYVPQKLRAINEEWPTNIFNTETKHAISFETYASNFAGRDFLSHDRERPFEYPNDHLPPPTELTEQSHTQYFASLLSLECEAKKRENERYALYAVSLQAIPPDGNGNWLWGLSVPGLREDSPFVEMGDELQIRQLWVDFNGTPIKVPTRTVTGRHDLAVYNSWTQKQYNASVYSVSRVREIVYLRVDGLVPLFLYHEQNILPVVVNVVFPIQQRVLQDQRKALVLIGRNLKEIQQRKQEARIDNDDSCETLFGLKQSVETSDHVLVATNGWVSKMLFPKEVHGKLQTQLRKVPHRALFDHVINYEQAHAVNSACAVDYGTMPYLISGPPGTGKTKTLVEVAMQLLNSTKVAHLLVCAPSEAAADTLAMRLKQYLSPKQLLRLNRPNRADNEVPRELLPYCYMQDDMFYLPPYKVLLSFAVVVASCRDAAILAEACLSNADLWTLERDLILALHPEDEPPIPSLHWGALLLDEAAQATEIDVLPAISVVCPPLAYPEHLAQPRLVMAGDENQLGPRTASHDPRFSNSLFARLSSRSVFAKHPLSRSNLKPYSGPPVLKRSMLPILYPPFTNLIRNYRSHPAILSVPSAHFYHDTLIPEAALANTSLQTSTLWLGRKWPVLYIPHNGPDELERDNGGWYNVSEACIACSIAQNLVFQAGVIQSDICIMSPFAAQVKLLRSMIRSGQYGDGRGLWDVNIGPVEAFQGLEKRVVIICTTRTRMRFLAGDVKRGMGLVGQQRRMNVALTRAREGLFVIGSPEVLATDENWEAWLAFCVRNELVDNSQGVWKDRDLFKKGKVGVLERALVAKEDGQQKKQWPALGAASADYDIDGGEYEAWTESLREALDEEAEEGDEEDEEGEEHGEDNEEDAEPESESDKK